MKFKVYRLLSICIGIALFSIGFIIRVDSARGDSTTQSSDQSEITIEQVGHISGTVNAVAVKDHYAYIAGDDGRFRVMDVSDPGSPVEAGGCELPGEVLDIEVYQDHAYVALGDSGLSIIDISSPTSPIHVGSDDTPGSAQRVAINGNFAYIADGDSGFRIVDVSDPGAPSEAGFSENSQFAYDVEVAGKYAYVTMGNLRVIEILSPDSPIEVGRSGSYDSIWVSGNYAYASGMTCTYAFVRQCFSVFWVIDVSNPGSPVRLGKIILLFSGYTRSYIYDVIVSGSYAYLADKDEGLWVINIMNPEAPEMVAHYDLAGETVSLDLADGYAYLANKGGGLSILRIDIVELGSDSAPGSIQ
jgi:hypothetical protein